MGLVACDSFDMYNGVGANTGLATKWAINDSSGVVVGMAAGRFGGQGVKFTGNNSRWGSVNRNLTSTRTSVGVNLSVIYSSLVSAVGAPFIIFSVGGAFQWGVGATTTGAITAGRFNGVSGAPGNTGQANLQATLGTGSAGFILNNTWHSIEVLGFTSSTVGTIQVYVDGVLALNLSGINNQQQASANLDQAQLWSVGLPDITHDDYVELDAAAQLGYPTRVEVLRAISDSAVAWSPHLGVGNFGNENETLVDGDTSYVSATAVATSDLYGFGALSSTPLAIYGVQPVDFAEKLDANPHTLYQQIKSGGTLNLGSAVSLTTGYNRFERMLTVDPNTSAAWTASAVNAVLHGPNLAS